MNKGLENDKGPQIRTEAILIKAEGNAREVKVEVRLSVCKDYVKFWKPVVCKQRTDERPTLSPTNAQVMNHQLQRSFVCNCSYLERLWGFYLVCNRFSNRRDIACVGCCWCASSCSKVCCCCSASEWGGRNASSNKHSDAQLFRVQNEHQQQRQRWGHDLTVTSQGRVQFPFHFLPFIWLCSQDSN